MNYDETWELMNNLEDVFNRIMAFGDNVERSKDAVDENNQEEIKDITDVLCYIILSMYNNTVS